MADEHPAPAPLAPEDLPAPVMTARLAATTLLLEAFVAFFTTLAAVALVPADGSSRAPVWTVGLVLTAVCVLAAGAARRPRGVAVGTAVQVLLVVGALLTPSAVVLPAVVVAVGFAALWWWLVSIGRRVDADRRRWARNLAARSGG